MAAVFEQRLVERFDRNGKKRGLPVHDNLVERGFTARAPNRLRLGDNAEHRISEGRVYTCNLKDVLSNHVVGYGINDRMKSRPAVDALT